MNEFISQRLIKVEPTPLSVVIDLDVWGGAGIKDIQITCNGNVYTLTKKSIERFLQHNALVQTKDYE